MYILTVKFDSSIKPLVNKSLLEEVGKLYVPAICDASDLLGIKPMLMDREIQEVWPGAKAVGIAATLKFAPLEHGEKFREEMVMEVLRLADKIVPGHMVVLDSSNAMLAGLLGQVTSSILMQKGAVGGVVDGAVRDLAQVKELKFPMWARGRVATSIRGRMKVTEMQTAIKCGGQTVRPNDIVFGDQNGVVVIQPEHADEVLKKAKELAKTDSWWFDQVRKGKRNIIELEKEQPLP
jgi:regulator of RNase E activity RraA